MDEEVETLLLEVRATVAPFKRDVAEMRAEVDRSLGSGLEIAGRSLERSLSRALRTGKLGFDDLKAAALRAMDDIAAASLRALMPRGGSGGLGGILGGLVGSVLGLPGRAHGGPVSEGRPYVVGERGPEVFVPGSSGQVQPMAGNASQTIVNIRLSSPMAAREVPVMARSSRQVGHAVRRALREAKR